jgi:hypothetical protein
MFSDVERRYLITLAQVCKRQGLTQAEAFLAIRSDVGAFSPPSRIKCALTSVFTRPDHSAAIF